MWVCDFDGCVSTGKTLEEVKTDIAEAIEMHIASLRDHEEPVPPPIANVAVDQVASLDEFISPETRRRMSILFFLRKLGASVCSSERKRQRNRSRQLPFLRVELRRGVGDTL